MATLSCSYCIRIPTGSESISPKSMDDDDGRRVSRNQSQEAECSAARNASDPPPPPTSDSRGLCHGFGASIGRAGRHRKSGSRVCDGGGRDVDFARGARTLGRSVGRISPADRVPESSRRRPAGRSVLFGSTSDAGGLSPRFVGYSEWWPAATLAGFQSIFNILLARHRRRAGQAAAAAAAAEAVAAGVAKHRPWSDADVVVVVVVVVGDHGPVPGVQCRRGRRQRQTATVRVKRQSNTTADRVYVWPSRCVVLRQLSARRTRARRGSQLACRTGSTRATRHIFPQRAAIHLCA
jgi:hypothetical protein